MRYFLISDSPDALSGLRLAGIEGVRCDTRAEALAALEQALQDPEIGILLITDTLAAQCEDRVKELQLHGRQPLLVEIPGNAQAHRNGASLSSVIQDAIGIQL